MFRIIGTVFVSIIELIVALFIPADHTITHEYYLREYYDDTFGIYTGYDCLIDIDETPPKTVVWARLEDDIVLYLPNEKDAFYLINDEKKECEYITTEKIMVSLKLNEHQWESSPFLCVNSSFSYCTYA